MITHFILGFLSQLLSRFGLPSIMHLVSTCSSLIILASIIRTIFAAQDLQGCADVDCPNVSSDNIDISCQVQDQDSTYIGLESGPNPINISAGNFTWTLTVQPEPYLFGGDINVPGVTRSFYLGTPAGTRLKDVNYTGCALFFDRPVGHGFVTPPDSGDPSQTTSSSCSWALGEGSDDGCLRDLQTTALKVADAATGDQDSTTICANIAEFISDNASASCSRLQQNDVLDYTVHAIALTGADAPEPINSASNASSNCWPTLPKTNELTHLYSYNFSSNESFPLFAYSPVMSLFFDTEDSGSGSDRLQESSFHCLKAIDSDDASLAIKTNGSSNDVVPNLASRKRMDGWATCLFAVTMMDLTSCEF